MVERGDELAVIRIWENGQLPRRMYVGYCGREMANQGEMRPGGKSVCAAAAFLTLRSGFYHFVRVSVESKHKETCDGICASRSHLKHEEAKLRAAHTDNFRQGVSC
jgi:hypothetical protein